MSPSSESAFANTGSFLVSPATYLTFSMRSISPALRSFAAAFTLSSTTTSEGTNLTSFPVSSASLFATGARLNSGFGSPLGLPRCDMSTTDAPCSRRYSMLGRAALMRMSSVILSPSRGTLKSHLITALLPVQSMSLIVFFMYDSPLCYHRK